MSNYPGNRQNPTTMEGQPSAPLVDNIQPSYQTQQLQFQQQQQQQQQQLQFQQQAQMQQPYQPPQNQYQQHPQAQTPFQQPHQSQPQQTIVVTQQQQAPILNPYTVGMTNYPVAGACPYCKSNISTMIRKEKGNGFWLAVFGLCFTTGCCCIPFCTDTCLDTVHSCPRCNAVVGKRTFL